MHAVSVGEAISAAGLLEALRARYPGTPLYVSVTTVAGREVAERKLDGVVDAIFYAPIDYAFAVRRVLRRLRPAVLVVLETEIWPVLYREAKRSGCSLLVLNGRISDRAYPRYLRWQFVFRNALALPDAIFTQSEQDRKRYIEIGAPPRKVETLGNLKYDAAPVRSAAPKPILELLEKLRPAAVWIAASTMAGVDSGDVDEDDAVLSAFQELIGAHHGLLLILVPRKPERFDSAGQRLHAANIRYVRRSQYTNDSPVELPCVLLLDSMGELASLFPLADIVFMGGTLARRGGHNLLEPAASARAIVSGPHLENFAAIAAEFRAGRAMLEIEDAQALAPAIERLIADPGLRHDLGARAAEVALKQRGVTRKALEQIAKWYDCGLPRRTRGGLAWLVLSPLSKIWSVASTWRIRRDSSRSRRLDTRVVSIGGLSMGGTGKTPMVEYLAARLRETGHQPAILTRGYGRRSIAETIVVEAGDHVPVELTGDETQIFLRSGAAHIGIGADRWATGRIVEEKLRPDIFLLDDGFQHRRLARDLDIVLLDALNPLAGGAVFPLGRLREPWKALSRADVFVIMRAQPDRQYTGLEDQLRAANPRAPIFRAEVEPRYWVNYLTGERVQAPEGLAAAFCGLGNPASFWTTLKTLQIEPTFQWSFGDHHRYTFQQVKHFAMRACLQRATVLLTTEKDAVNLPEGSGHVLMDAGVELYWLKIGVRITNELQLMSLIESKARKLAAR